MNAVDPGMALDIAHGMDVEFAEPAADILELVDRQVLVAEEQHLVAHPAIMERVEGGVRQGLGEVDAVNLGADARRQRVEMQTVR